MGLAPSGTAGPCGPGHLSPRPGAGRAAVRPDLPGQGPAAPVTKPRRCAGPVTPADAEGEAQVRTVVLGGSLGREHNGVMTDDLPSQNPRFHPRVFVSYSSQPGHDDWVRRLSTRLMSNGVDVILDQWNVPLGADLPHFMEHGLTASDRVIAVCSDKYIAKANAGRHGVGYEKKIMTPDLLIDANSDHIVPVIRDSTAQPPVPTFLAGSKYVDFRDNARFEPAYQELVRDLYGLKIHPRPVLGTNPFAMNSEIAKAQALRFDPTCFMSEALSGTVTYPYEDNNGRFVIGSGCNAFTLCVCTAGPGTIHVLSDPADISTIGLVPHTTIADVRSPENYDSSSRTRTPRVGDSVVLVNTSGRAAAIEVLEVTTRETAADGVAKLTLQYVIPPTGG